VSVRARFDFLGTGDDPPLLFHAPDRVIVARTVEDVPAVMAAVDQGLRDGFHAAGYVSYEAAAAFDDALVTRPASALPLVCFGLFRSIEAAPPLTEPTLPTSPRWTPSMTADEHARGVATVREAIAAGDTYQINYTFRLNAMQDPATVEALYAHLMRAERAPFAAHLDLGSDLGGWQLLSLSPELFFQLRDGRLVTRPMKGTAPRGRWAEEDTALRDGLATSTKNRAENVMIVDLGRNDMSRVCTVGSVAATSLFDVERYPTVWQMVSTVEGQVRPGVGLQDIFAALFPAGSITGAPKSSSMRLIAALEREPRGAYCGAIGYASPDGNATFSVAIRTMTVDAGTGQATYGIGGGITWDSVAGDEHDEAMQKAACLDIRPPFSLIETLRLEKGVFVRLGRHLDRLRASADYFGFECDVERLRTVLGAHAGTCTAEAHRVRLLLNRQGHVGVQIDRLLPTPAGPLMFTVATEPVNSRDRFLCHKTTRREVYERQGERQSAPHVEVAEASPWDVLLWNERGEVTEFTRGNLVLELDGVRCTPARESGLLAGVFRAELLDQHQVVERVLTREDLAQATRVWFINSVRGSVLVTVGDTGARARR